MSRATTPTDRLRACYEAVIPALSHYGSYFRIVCWTLLLLGLIFHTADRRFPEQHRSTFVTIGAASPASDTDHIFRIAVIGSSEVFDYENGRFGLAHSIAKGWDERLPEDIEVLQRASAMMSVQNKRNAIAEARDLNADLVIVSLPALHIVRAGMDPILEPGQETFWQTTARITTGFVNGPSGELLDLTQTRFPRIQSQLYQLYHTFPTGRVADDPNTSETTNNPAAGQTVDATDEDVPRTELQNNAPAVHTFESMKIAEPSEIADMFRRLALPILGSDTRMLILAAPNNLDALSRDQWDKVRLMSDNVDAAAAQFDQPGVRVVNLIQGHTIPPERFRDFIHLNDYTILADTLLNRAAEDNWLETIPAQNTEAP